MVISIFNLLIAVVLVEIGNGLQGVLIPIRGEVAGFPSALIGGLGTFYYAGFVVGCLVLPKTVRHFGHIRSFSALASVAASTALLHILFIFPWTWLAFRAAMGFCFAGLFMVMESWLNEFATSETRGQIFGTYMIVTWLGIVGGNMLFSVSSPEAFSLFAIVSITIALSLVPISLTWGAVPAIPQPARMGVGALYRIAPVGFVGCIAVGLANGAFWSLAPLFAQAQSDSSLGISFFMSACVMGGALSQWPIGRLSDRMDRRWVIVAVCLLSAAMGCVLALCSGVSDNGLLLLAALFGATSLSLYPLCVAHANDRADPTTFVEVSGHLLLAFGLGAIVGPLLAGILISLTGIASLFVFTAAIHMALALFVLVRIRLLRPPPEPERVAFSIQPPISHGTQVIVDLLQDAEQEATQTEDPDPLKTGPHQDSAT